MTQFTSLTVFLPVYIVHLIPIKVWFLFTSVVVFICQVRSAFLNATCFLKTGGHYMLYVQVFFFLLYLDVFFWWYFIHEIFVNHVTNQCKWQGNCIESTNRGDGVFSSLCATHQVQFKRMERVTLEPFDRDHAYVSGVFRTLEVSVWSVTQFAKAGLVPTISLRIYFSLLHFYGQTLKKWLKF
jgi:hypothetical protein